METTTVLPEVFGERCNQEIKWGEQNHPDGTGYPGAEREKRTAKYNCDTAGIFTLGERTWAHILKEEVAEALAETDPQALRKELIQVAAVAVAWVEAIDRRGQEAKERICTCEITSAGDVVRSPFCAKVHEVPR